MREDIAEVEPRPVELPVQMQVFEGQHKYYQYVIAFLIVVKPSFYNMISPEDTRHEEGVQHYHRYSADGRSFPYPPCSKCVPNQKRNGRKPERIMPVLQI